MTTNYVSKIMTVSYTGDVGNASAFGCFNKILFRWKGSVYKLVYKELLAYIALYLVINLTYRLVLVRNSSCDPDLESCVRWKQYRETFESLRGYCYQNIKSIPLMFVLGFYVTIVVTRWWDQFNLLPWPDSFAIMCVGMFKASRNDMRSRLMRRNIVRYITLSYCIALRTVSFRLKKRFPTLEHLVLSGIMQPNELETFQSLDNKVKFDIDNYHNADKNIQGICK